MKKFLFLLLLLIMPLNMYAISSSDVDYEIDDYIVDANIDISGNLLIKEVIKVSGSFNGYIRDLEYKNSDLSEFTGELEDFKGSSIYNGSNINIERVGTIDFDGELDFDIFSKEVKESSICNSKVNCYEESKLNNGISLKMYNETDNDSTYFYIEYLVGNVVVIHEDIAEIYFNFIGDAFDDEIENYKLRITLPYSTKEQIRVWAHGPLTGNVYLIEKDDVFYGGYLEVSDLAPNTPVDMRMTFPKELISVDHPFLKKSGVSALENIISVEEERADEANALRKTARIKVYGTYAISGAYILITILLIIYIYLKYDKEVKTSFEGEYYRDFIDEYDVTAIEYLFDKRISEIGFSTSILNMIYKKNISFTQLDKKDYMLTKNNEDNLSEAELLIMKIIFDEAGDGKTTTLNKIKDYASNLNGTKSPFLNLYDKWKNKVTSDSVKENFYENNNKIKLYFGLYSILGFIVLFLLIRMKINNVLIFFIILAGAILFIYLSIFKYKNLIVGFLSLFIFIYMEVFNIVILLVLLVTIIFTIYLAGFSKRTPRGALHYAKWSAFKRFLEDFGRFDEKELPEITLWERYLVYASIFGIADKVGKTMKIKFNEFNYTNDKDVLFDYMMWRNINNSINRTISHSVSTAQTMVAEATARELASSNNSSGRGFGGGFSGGGGFGGGGGGGRGF